jgi:hypothetical protein
MIGQVGLVVIRNLAIVSLLLLFSSPGWGETLRVGYARFEGKTLTRPSGELYAALEPLAQAFGVQVLGAGNGYRVAPLVGMQDRLPDVPAGKLQVGSTLIDVFESEDGHLYVPALAFCQALGGSVRRRTDDLNLIPSSHPFAHAAAPQEQKQTALSPATAQLRRRDPATFFIAQTQGDNNRAALRYNGNCGPTCLAMAAVAYDRFPRWLNNPNDRQELILWCRKSMTGHVDQQAGVRSRQMEEAAAQLHLNPRYLRKFAGLDAELEAGRMAIVTGRPNTLGFHNYDQRMSHAMLVVAKSGDDYIINDPGGFYRSPGTRLTSAQLKAYFRQAVTVGDR